MGRYVDLDISGYLAFEDAPSPDLTESQARAALVEFLSLRTRLVSTREWRSACLAFARKHGSLLPRASKALLPAGVLSFAEDPSDMPHGRRIVVEPEAQWVSWSLRLRDVALVHSWRWLPWRHAEAPYVRMLRDNLIDYEGEAGRMCLFRASAASSSRRLPDGLPGDVAAYLAALGSPFCFASPILGEGMPARAAWVDENADALLAALLENCVGSPLPTDGSLLSRLKRELAVVVAGDKPMGFCLACGAATMPEARRRPAHSESAVHRMALSRGREAFASSLADAGFSAGEAEAMLGSHDTN